MKIKLMLLVLVALQVACKNDTERQITSVELESLKVLSQKEKTRTFNFSNFKITKGKIGKIKVGMDIIDAEKLLNDLTKKTTQAHDFGFDGGGIAYIYSLRNEPILALIPKRDSQEILVIIALSKNLKTNNGLNPKSTVTEIQEKYPNIEINQNLMMSWEFMSDETNNWDFVFMTDENNSIGTYTEIEVPTQPVRIETKMDWITIK
jgi:hypothetical protein